MCCDTPESVLATPARPGKRRYSALMKSLRVLSPLLTLLFVGSMALAQEASPAVPDTPQPQDSATTQPRENSVADTRESGEGSLISQVRQYPRFPRRPMRPPRGPAYSAFPPPPGFSPVGALIGFGAGALLGASKAGDNAGNTRAGLVLIGGGLGALFGGVIGGIVGGPHSFRHHGRYGPSWPGEDEEGSLRSHSKDRPEKPTSAKAAEPRETPMAQDGASPSSTRPASRQGSE